jgi:hypothetical protein
MKAKFLWMIPVIALVSSCEKNEEQAAVPDSKPKTFRPLGSKRSAEREKEVAAAEETTESLEEAVDEPISSVPSAALAAVTPQAPAAGTPGGPLTQEQRDAYKAQLQAKRFAELKVQMSSRFKEQDANGDGILTQNEVSERMQRGFTRADTNGDGSLDATEQEAMIQNFSNRVSEGRQRGDRGGFRPRQGRGRD